MLKKIFFIVLFFLIGFGALGFYLHISFSSYRTPTISPFLAAPGTSLRQISRQLKSEGIIPNAWHFELLARLEKVSLKAGEYEFQEGLTPQEVLNILVKGKTKLYSITIPEGFNLQEMGKRFIEKKIVTASQWEQITHDTSLIADMAPQATSLEGYLFPQTYLYDSQIKIGNLLTQMVGLLRGQITPDRLTQAKNQNLTLHQWITLASIVEKETGVPSERPLIASVFLNRLRLGMLLQTDPTVIYGISRFNGNLTRADLAADTPYNTYTRAGLPPGPICSPGLDSLLAVLNPANTNYLYFVARGDGTHQFSETLDEHNKAVNTYQRGM